MYKPRYSFSKVSDVVRFYDSGVFQFSFPAGNFNRPLFESYAVENNLSSNWVGAMLRLFYQYYPFVYPCRKRNDAERFLSQYGDQAGVDILKSKGFQVVFKFESSIQELIEALEIRGYEIKHWVDQEFESSGVPA